MIALQSLDIIVVVAYLAVVAVIGIAVSRKSTSSEELFLAGRSLGGLAIGLSLFASNISSTTLIGVAGAAYGQGIAVAHYELWAALILVFMALFTIPVLLRTRITTIPEYLGRRFGRGVQRYVSALTIFLSIFVDAAGSVYAGILVLQVLVPDVPFVPACIGLALFAGAYTMAGGLRGVVYTDVIQALVLIAGSLALSYAVFARFDFSWAAVVAAVPADHLSLIRPASDDAMPWTGVLIGLPVLGFYYWGANQYIMQRVLGARSLESARRGAMLAAALKILPLFMMALPAAMALALLPPLDNGDQVFPMMVSHFLPVGMVGLVLSGLLAAIMSTIDSTLNSAATLVMYDFAGADRRQWSPAHAVTLGRLVTVGFIVIAALWPLVIREFPGLFNYIQQVFSYAVPPVVAVFLMGLFWRRATRAGAWAALLFGHGLGLALLGLRLGLARAGVADPLPHFTVVAGLSTLACVGVGAAVSRACPAPPAAGHAGTLWVRGDAGGRLRGLGDDRVMAVAILVAVGVIVWVFR
ncbi:MULTISPECIES: sodium:solute symporter family transporter [unclassified Xanthobacter]|uniref:sodium:solute symporter family transporter n=1 Tax=unclassified Xanthobacter TaxID=2623496 RepID=UPI001EDE395E|nr:MULTISPECIES: sodium/solute symporter [unclassified Xanthobacter]